MVGAQIVTMAPAASGLHDPADALHCGLRPVVYATAFGANKSCFHQHELSTCLPTLRARKAVHPKYTPKQRTPRPTARPPTPTPRQSLPHTRRTRPLLKDPGHRPRATALGRHSPPDLAGADHGGEHRDGRDLLARSGHAVGYRRARLDPCSATHQGELDPSAPPLHHRKVNPRYGEVLYRGRISERPIASAPSQAHLLHPCRRRSTPDPLLRR